jgi:hypothetical protein
VSAVQKADIGAAYTAAEGAVSSLSITETALFMGRCVTILGYLGYTISDLLHLSLFDSLHGAFVKFCAWSEVARIINQPRNPSLAMFPGLIGPQDEGGRL